MKIILTFLLAVLCTACFCQDNYKAAWKALGENNREKARQLLLEASKDDKTAQDAYITRIYLDAYDGKEAGTTDFVDRFYKTYSDSYPYIYALWFNEGLVGNGGKKELKHQLELINKLIDDEKAPGSLVASANYQKGMHLVFSNDMEKAQPYYDRLGNIRDWQFTGPFENISESGFYKNYGPLEKPEPSAVFKSISNADVRWFTPAAEIKDGWTPLSYQFNKTTAVVYAQNFVTSATDQPVYCNVGFSGSIKVWINDELVISEANERLTELDAYTVKCSLNKGVNRVLVQLGYTGNSYPNFTLRFTDENFRVIDNIKGSPVYAPYTRVQQPKGYTLVPQFAEAFFLARIAKEPDNLVNYMLLTDTYMRSKKTKEARELLSKALDKAPDNSLLRAKLLDVLIKENNRTLLLEETEKIKQADPESLLVLELKIKEFFDSEKYEDGSAVLKRRIALFGEDATTVMYSILLLIKDKKYDLMITEAEKMYKKYPSNSRLVKMMYSIKKDVYKDNKAAMKVYEQFLKDNYSYEVYTDYADALADNGNKKAVLNIKQKLAGYFPYDPWEFYNLAKYYYGAKEYDNARTAINKALALSPYNESYWEKLGDIEGEMNNTAEALSAYTNALLYNPNQYDIINKVRSLSGKSDLYKLLPENDISALIKADKPEEAKNSDYGSYYILNQKDVILYKGGATEEYYTIVIRITNEKGIDEYKESSIGYNSTQSLLIDKAEVIKKNQTKIEGEKNDNNIVFTNLEVGDVIVFKYRLQSYVYGRFAKEYWDKYYFIGHYYTAQTNYNILVPADQPIKTECSGFNGKPVITDVENFKRYSWSISKAEPLKNESLMPVIADVGGVLHLTTLNNWSEIANWYSDIINNKAEEDFEVKEVYRKIFADAPKKDTEFGKARTIYNYIENNIRYSSVSFRQSNYVPQRPSLTLSTRLGDCKDLSSLFVTFLQMAGIKAQMVLVDTRDNGQKDMVLPSMEFNHCIVKAVLDGKAYYIELTDNHLPFASLPNNLNGAIILEIPYRSATATEAIKFLRSDTRTKDVVKRIINIRPDENNIDVDVKTIKYGAHSSSVRDAYGSLENDKQLQELEKVVAQSYKNNVRLSKVAFSGLDKLDDSVAYTYNYKVKDEVVQIGSLYTFKIAYPDVVASVNSFSADTRSYPIEYWKYEDADVYETTVNITAPAGKKFTELPASESFGFKDMKFSITYTLKAPDKLAISRKFSCNRADLDAADYPAFKSFFEKIVKAEQKFIAFK